MPWRQNHGRKGRNKKMIKIEANNQKVIELKYKNNWTVVTVKNSKGNIEKRYGIEDGDLVMLLNYYQNCKYGLEISDYIKEY